MMFQGGVTVTIPNESTFLWFYSPKHGLRNFTSPDPEHKISSGKKHTNQLVFCLV